MKVFTFFYNRYETATTSNALTQNGIEHKVLCHSRDDATKFIDGDTARMQDIIITDKPKGLTYQRNAALDLMKNDEWAVFMCDDFKHILGRPEVEILGPQETLDVTIANQRIHRLRAHRDEYTLKRMFGLFPYLISKAEAQGVRLIGFGLHDNPLNLRRKFSYRGLADGRFWLIKKHATVRFDERVQMIDDVAWTAENIKQFGKVMVLNWIVPYFRRYTADGFGSISARLEQRLAECKYLVDKYSPLVRYADKPGWPEGCHIRIQWSGEINQTGTLKQMEFDFK